MEARKLWKTIADLSFPRCLIFRGRNLALEDLVFLSSGGAENTGEPEHLENRLQTGGGHRRLQRPTPALPSRKWVWKSSRFSRRSMWKIIRDARIATSNDTEHQGITRSNPQ